ncbi:hypothetical protein P8605_19340 [Streptomyces sp. T-3]|nr:hypothetical protein [Streptomyces sp. T-3]
MISWVTVEVNWARWAAVPDALGRRSAARWRSEKHWAKEAAKLLLLSNDLADTRVQVRQTAKVLIAHRQAMANEPTAQEMQKFLYFATPFDAPIPLLVASGPAEGERDITLRRLARADSTKTVRPPVVSEIATERLGTGVRSLNHVPVDGDVSLNLWYGLRDERQGVDVMAFTSSDEPAQLLAAKQDFDDFVKAITVHTEEIPDDTGDA